MKYEIKEKAYRVFVDEMFGNYPFFNMGDIDVVYSDSREKARMKFNYWDSGLKEDIPYTKIKAIRAKEHDVILYKGEKIRRFLLKSKIKQEVRNKKVLALPEKEKFYVQDARSYSGNYLVWWEKGGSGYTSNINNAHKFTKDEIIKSFTNGRETDIIWFASHVEEKKVQVIDCQNLKGEFKI